MLGKFWQVQLKGKLVFSLANRLHRFQFQFAVVHDIRYMNLKLNFNCKLKLQFEISNCNFMLGKFWQVHLKGKVVFSLAYGLHRFQIQFHF